MNILRFCRDGVLRHDFHVFNPQTREHVFEYVPLLAMAELREDVFSGILGHHVQFEDGLTMGELMENLAPWAKEMTGFACMDFAAFLEEARSGSSRRVDDVPEICLEYRFELAPVPHFERRKAGESRRYFAGKPVEGNDYHFEFGWDAVARLGAASSDGGEGDAVSLRYVPMSEWQHIPLRISRVAKFRDRTAGDHDQRYMIHKLPITNPAHPDISAVGNNGLVWKQELKIEAPEPRFYDTIIRGLFDEMISDYSPQKREEAVAELQRRVDEIDSGAAKTIPMDEVVLDLEAPAEPLQEDDPELLRFQAMKRRLQEVHEISKRLGLSSIVPKRVKNGED